MSFRDINHSRLWGDSSLHCHSYANSPLPISICVLHQGGLYNRLYLETRTAYLRKVLGSIKDAGILETPPPESVVSLSDFGATGPPDESMHK